MAREEPQVNIRMPADLKAKLEECAAASRRSLTAEVIARLEASLEAGSARTLTAAEIEERLSRLERLVAEAGVIGKPKGTKR